MTALIANHSKQRSTIRILCECPRLSFGISFKVIDSLPTFMQCGVYGTVGLRYFLRPFTGRMPLALAAGLLLPFHLTGQAIQAPVPGGAAPSAQVSGAPPAGEAQAQLEELQGALKSAVAAHDARTAGKILNHIGELW